jgi:hypothetical protein
MKELGREGAAAPCGGCGWASCRRLVLGVAWRGSEGGGVVEKKMRQRRGGHVASGAGYSVNPLDQ